MKKILFPTDFSPTADQAYIYALKIADKLEASITTLHVYQLPNVHGVTLPHTLREIYDNIELEEFKNYEDAIPHLDKIAEDQNLSHIGTKHVLQEGNTRDTILRVAKKDDIDLIVMGTKGASGFKEIFVGSDTGEIMEKANCPVLGVPEEAVFDGKIDQIAVTTSYREEDEELLQNVLAFAQHFGANVHCVNVDLSNTEYYLKRMDDLKEKYADQYPKLHFHVLAGNDLLGELTTFMKDHQIDFLALLTHKRNFLQELFNFSVAKQLIYHSKTPILAYQAG